MSLFSNPEILRNARIQLRPRKLLIAAGICAALSLAIGYAFAYSPDGLAGSDGNSFFQTILILQAIVLVIGGGLACLPGVQREKDQSTYDFQRLTRLSPFELSLGKLFGPPLLALFIFLCFMPAAVVGAVAAHTPPTIFLAAYGLLILGSIVYDAFALAMSLFLRRGTVTWAIIGFLAIVGGTSSGFGYTLGVISPFGSIPLIRRHDWSLPLSGSWVQSNPAVGFRDLFLGFPVHHALVLFILYLTLLAWFIPAIARNIKRDPANYELYTPPQALGFLCYLNFIVFAFCQWQPLGSYAERHPVSIPPLDVQSFLLAMNIILFFIFGFILLRNRNQVRRLLHSGAAGHLETWPAPYLFLGALIVGVAMILVIQWKRDPSLEWSLPVAIFRVTYFAFWLICDFLFLQWTKIQRGGHSLVMGVLYLGVYYACAITIVASLHAEHNPFTAIFLPTPLFVLDTAAWSAHLGVWILALILQIAAGVAFVVLQRRTLANLQPHVSSISMNAPASASL